MILASNQKDPDLGRKVGTARFAKSYMKVLPRPVRCVELPEKAKQDKRKERKSSEILHTTPDAAVACAYVCCACACSRPGASPFVYACVGCRTEPDGIHPLGPAVRPGT